MMTERFLRSAPDEPVRVSFSPPPKLSEIRSYICEFKAKLYQERSLPWTVSESEKAPNGISLPCNRATTRLRMFLSNSMRRLWLWICGDLFGAELGTGGADWPATNDAVRMIVEKKVFVMVCDYAEIP